MSTADPSMLYITLVLPALFSLSMIFEGVHKFMEKQSGWVPMIMGIIFLLVTITSYFMFQ
ncbi:hypothetical protein COW99_05245 [Candidatus Roizmanbacteria bacterium CG22_combo_CG10-13_8_21_14_all_38_20]|uniref:Uncharacterized protein n=1 Tax=Candidatus Roizmanbacteria bacterium CG22_combo_CG10-13_8_21_14_all_38_20 TaxID=1974862 RepID=A0A2H0BVU9_9BACT|nr:hypothetical protein [Candidatus Microgenomates bacterium]PIP61170.1 MAG: hypothetical protein COW99_05245 [Candidatus Roizmanbacteria bacterium CG22_combo_CG10-13_8_21_14_all_38_20]PJC31160.1 MAG: hypothetical protein CO050_03910 [Candidatus Roizmanbacteria bacterium CG_4_9_14_0_2_um_filter_38_17]